MTVPFGSCIASTFKSTTLEATPLLMGVRLNRIAYVHLSSKPASVAACNIVVTRLAVHIAWYTHMHVYHLHASAYACMYVCFTAYSRLPDKAQSAIAGRRLQSENFAVMLELSAREGL